MISLDGNYLEGGGQIVRTALALSVITGKEFEVNNIRKGRKNPGLKNQHLFCVKALQELCNAKVKGAELGSEYLKYKPGKIEGKTISIDIGTAGSITLLLQALLLPSIFSEKKVRFKIKGGTDVKWSMSVNYFIEILLPQLRKYADIDFKLERRGYYPKGNGKVDIKINPSRKSQKIELTGQGYLLHIKGVSHAHIELQKAEVAERQARAAKLVLNKLNIPVQIRTEYVNTDSIGSGITLWAIFSKDKDEIDFNNPIRIGSDCLGERVKRAEDVGNEAAQKLVEEINFKAPVDRYLGDQILPFMAVFSPSKIKVSLVTNHCKTNMYVIEKFLPVKFKITGQLIECSNL